MHRLLNYIVALFFISLSSKAEFYIIKIKDLQFEKKSEELAKALEENQNYSTWGLSSRNNILSARTPSSVTSYISPQLAVFKDNNSNRSLAASATFMALDVTDNKPFTGVLDIPQFSFRTYGTETSSHRFSFDPAKHQPAKKEEFEQIKKLHYHVLAQTNNLGKPWFHSESKGLDLKESAPIADRFNRSQFSLYTGGRAVSDNLALDRELRLMGQDTDATVDLKSIQGIKTKAIDWKDLMPNEEVEIDTLAMLIPEDQHVLICPSLTDLNKIVALLENEGSPLAQSFSVRNPFRTLPQRYKERMGVNFPPALARLLPIKSVAITGFDPFFPTGTDIALLIESAKPEALFKMIDNTIDTPHSHVALVGKTVVISNSKKQLARIQSVSDGKTVSLGSLDEYKFFRHRYPIADKPTGFVFLSDACIRRWGGPHMRIAASRRTKSIAALNNLTARQIAFSKDSALLVDNETLNDSYQFLLGKVTNDNGLIQSTKMGNLHWLKPSIEMELDKVTKTEAAAYEEWRRGYEEGWAKVFDPIGFSFNIDDETKELDLTVMPLTMSNDYQEFISIVGNATLSREARIAHKENIITASLALDKDGEMLADMNQSMTSMLPNLKIKPLGWLGDSVTLFVEHDKRWALLGEGEDPLSLESILTGSPIGLRIEHNSKLKLAMFLTALKTTVESSAPDAVKWETKKHGEVKYVVLTSNEAGLPDGFSICYVVTKSALIFSLNEKVLHRAIDSENTEQKLALTPTQENADHIYINADSRLLATLVSASDISISERRRTQSYRAIPILNEWYRLSQDSDPVIDHFNRFGEDIYCPGGKGYQWNAQDMTMESVTYGHPAKQKKNTDKQHILDPFAHIESAIKFEHDGLRVKLKLKKSK